MQTDDFASAITDLTRPINDQYPRPWMTTLRDPLSANVYVVGKNQAKGYPTARLTHQRHLDALFNRAGQSCRALYDELTDGFSSPTRKHTDRLREELEKTSNVKLLETNVICYSTPMSSDLRLPRHVGGVQRGTEIFETLLHFGKPKVLVAHGAGTQESLGRLLKIELPEVPDRLGDPVPTKVLAMTIFVIPSLAPPEWNKWHRWSNEYFAKLARAVAAAV